MSGLRFHPQMTLQAAARLADKHGLEIVLRFNGYVAVVTTIPKLEFDKVPPLLQQQAG